MQKIALFVGSGSISQDLLSLIERENFKYRVFARFPIFGHNTEVMNFLDLHSYEQELIKFSPDIVYSSIWGHKFKGYQMSPDNTLYSKATIELFKFSKRIGVNFFIAVGSGDEHKKKSSNIYIHEKQRVFNHLSSNSNESDYCWLRPFQIYGKRGCSGILDQLVDARLKGNQIILENSDDVFHWTSSNDVARAVLAALKGRIPGAHDIAHKDANSVLNFALIFSDLLQLDSEYIRKSQLISINSEYIKPNFTSKLHTAWEARDSIFSGLQRYVS